MTRFFATVLLSLGLFSTVLAQVESKEEFVFDFAPVYQASELIYYGADFSQFGFCYPDKVGQEEQMLKFIPAWLGDLNKIYSLDVLPRLMKKKVVGRLQSVQNKYKLIGEEWILFEPTTFGIEKVKTEVKNYQLEETSGIGLVLIVENFDKIHENGIVYFALFDIASREVLYCNKMEGVAVGAGMTNHWASVLTSSFDVFITEYREQLHRAKKTKK
ncbi:MAG: hypothetical protein WC044_09295 [Crocinitomicaceae bacterium]